MLQRENDACPEPLHVRVVVERSMREPGVRSDSFDSPRHQLIPFAIQQEIRLRRIRSESLQYRYNIILNVFSAT